MSIESNQKQTEPLPTVANLDILAAGGIITLKEYYSFTLTHEVFVNRKWLTRTIELAAITLTIAAVLQELEKPAEERQWHGRVARFIPYDFRLPSLQRIKETYWNPYDSRIFNPEVFGIGWAVNFYALLERFRQLGESYLSEEDFLMPTKTIKDLITRSTVSGEG